MSLTFYVGQRVRIDCPHSDAHGKEATIWNTSTMPWSDVSHAVGIQNGETGYQVDVDGIGRRWPLSGKRISFPARFLRPLLPPQQTVTWAECPWAPDKVREVVGA